MKLLPRSRHSKHDGKGRHIAVAQDEPASQLAGKVDEGFLDLENDKEMMDGLDGPQVVEKKVDQDFFNTFDDDCDESDMKGQ